MTERPDEGTISGDWFNARRFIGIALLLRSAVLGGAGLGAVLVATFAPLRPYFLAVSGVLLVGGFYLVYRKPKLAEACAGETCAPESGTRRMAKPLLWVAALAVAALGFFTSYGLKLAGKPAAAASISSATLQTAELKIKGMDCPVCSGLIQRKLLETPGVVKAEGAVPGWFGNSAIRLFENRYKQVDRSCERYWVQGNGFEFCARIRRSDVVGDARYRSQTYVICLSDARIRCAIHAGRNFSGEHDEI